MIKKNKNILSNKIIAHRYKIIKQLGKGGMGIVYQIEDILKDNKLEAVKIIRQEKVDKNTLEIFRQEFDVMTRLRHPNLAQVYDFGFDQQENQYFITMEYIDGISLKNQLKLQGIFTQGQTIDIIVALCRTLEFIHTRKIFHNDIKPGNIILQNVQRPGSEIKVLDFGLSALGKTKDKNVRGTLHYMAPETLFGTITRQTDVYAAGVTFYELLTGKNFCPMVETTGIINILKDKREFIKNINVALEKVKNLGIRKIIARMLEYNPRDRYQYCSEIIHDINKNLKRSYALETAETKEAYVSGAGFVGRKEELAALKEKLDLPEPEKVVVVIGRAGIGKSRLYNEFRKYCQLKNIHFLEANCSEKVSKTFAPFRDIISEALLKALPDQINQYGPELKKILSDHTRLMDIETASLQKDVRIKQRILVNNITGFLLDYAQKYEHVVVYLNDIHLADEGSLEALKELMYKLSLEENRENNLRVYASAREEEIGNIESFIKDLREKTRLEQISLHPFDTDHVAKYLEAIFGDGYIDSSLRKAIPEIGGKVGGNPFFLQELIKSFVERGFITKNSLKWELKQSIRDSDIPDSLKEIIRRRLQDLKLLDSEKEMLELLAVFNKEISVKTFNQLFSERIDTNTEEIFADFERNELFSSEIIEGSVVFRFAHSIIREVVEDEVEDVKILHYYIAEKIETECNPKEFVEDLAYHYSRTKDSEKAMIYLEKAGNQAKNSYANEKALGYYDQLLDLLKNENTEKRINILIKKSEILDRTGRWNDASKVLNGALKLPETMNYKILSGKIYNLLGNILLKIGDYSQAMSCYKSSLKINKELGNQRDIGIIVGNMGNIYLAKGDNSQALNYYENSLRIAEENGNVSAIQINIGTMYLRQGDNSRAMEFFDKALT